MNETALFFLGYGAFFGGLAGWWAGRRQYRRGDSRQRAAELATMFRAWAASGDDPDLARRARLAYDTAYDEKHPEEWA